MSTRGLDEDRDINVLDPAKKPRYGFGQSGELRVNGFGHDAAFELAISKREYSNIYIRAHHGSMAHGWAYERRRVAWSSAHCGRHK